MHTIDLIIFLLFTLGVVVMGSSFFHKGTSSEEYTSANHSLPGWVVGMSIFSSFVSSISYLGYPGSAYAGNWNSFVFCLSIPIAAVIAANWFVPFYRKQNTVSTYQFLEERFGLWARIYASVCYLLTQVARTGAIMYLLAVPMNILLGWDMKTVIIVTSIAIIIYSVLGGIKGVVWTEAVQGFIMIGGALLCLVLLWVNMPQGIGKAIEMAGEEGKFSLGSYSLTDWSTSTFWVCMIYGIFTNLQNYGIDQSYVQRYHTARTEKDARFSVLLGGWILIPVSLLFFLIGTSLYCYYSQQPGVLPEGLKADYVFPFYIVNALPTGVTGILVASIFAAGMSTIATSITSSSTVILTDYYERMRTNADDKEKVRVLKVSGIIVGLLGMLIAIALINVESILDTWWKLSSIFSGGMLGLFLLGFLTRRVSNKAALIGALAGIMMICWISAYNWVGLPNPHIHSYMAIVLGTATIFFVGFIAGLFLKGDKAEAIDNNNHDNRPATGKE